MQPRPETLARAPRRLPAAQAPALVAAPLIAAAALALAASGRPRQALLLAIGAALGLVLHHSSFSFAGAWRHWLVRGDRAAVAPHLLLLAALVPLSALLFALGPMMGQGMTGFSAALGPGFAFGAALFGLGMQLAGGCGSGTLYSAGAGSLRMMVALATFIAGSFAGSLHQHWWEALGGIEPPRLDAMFGWPGAFAVQLALIAAAWLALGRPGLRAAAAPVRLLRGPWSPAVGALALALLSALTLLVAGHPWGITFAFAVWGGKLARLLGWDPSGAPAWNDSALAAALAEPLADNSVSVMDLGLFLGAMLAAGLAGRFGPLARVGRRPLAAAILGGLAMGYGARLSAGCNIGAFVSGVASYSLHGWAWAACAVPGCLLGIRLRPRFGLPV